MIMTWFVNVSVQFNVVTINKKPTTIALKVPPKIKNKKETDLTSER